MLTVLFLIVIFLISYCEENQKKLLFDYMKKFNLIKEESELTINTEKYKYASGYIEGYSTFVYDSEIQFLDGSYFYITFSKKSKDLLIISAIKFKNIDKTEITENQAFEYIQKYLKIICPEISFNDFKLIELNRPEDPIYEFFYEKWRFTYIRKYKGYEVDGRFQGSIRPDGAFLGCIKTFSESTCETIVNISIDKATEIAKKYMESDECSINVMKRKMYKRDVPNLEVEIIKAPSIENGFKKFSIVSDSKLDLSKPVIVVKNNFLIIDHYTVKSPSEIWGDRENIALAWVLGVKQKKHGIPTGNFIIYIDTKTGEVIGGQFS